MAHPMECPVCRRALTSEDILVVHGGRGLIMVPRFNFSVAVMPGVAKLFELILREPGIHRKKLLSALQMNEGTLKVYLCHLRKALAPIRATVDGPPVGRSDGTISTYQIKFKREAVASPQAFSLAAE